MKPLTSVPLLLAATLLCAAFAPPLFAQPPAPPAAPPAVAPPAAAPPAAAPPTTQTATPPTIKFDIVTFKPCEPGTFGPVQALIPASGDFISMRCQTVHHMLEFAYDGSVPYMVKGEPGWLATDRYTMQAKVAPEDVPVWQKLDSPGRRLMVLAALTEALNMKMRLVVEARPVYALVLAKDGPKFSEHKSNPDAKPDDQKITIGDVAWIAPDTAQYTNVTMGQLAAGIAARMDRDVVDRTGLTGRYDVTVHPLPSPHYDPKSLDAASTDFSAIIAGVKDLGLRLEPSKADTFIFNVDHIDRPPSD
jgi:uncharacterized protein (TIGR03435 family)